MRIVCLLLLLIPCLCLAQSPVDPPNALTMRLLMAQRPAKVTVEQWQRTIHNPVNAAAYPIHLTQATLDTIDVKQLDRRYHYVLVPEKREGAERQR